MARPRIGIFGALFAVGSVLAWKWMQSQDTARKRAARDLNRWEDEGGKVVTPSTRRKRRPPTRTAAARSAARPKRGIFRAAEPAARRRDPQCIDARPHGRAFYLDKAL